MKLDSIEYNGPATYELIEPGTNIRYIGATSTARNRMQKHLTGLRCNTHKNKKLNELFYKHNGEFDIIIHEKETKEDALNYENELLIKYKNSGLLLNILEANGKHAEETKLKISKTRIRRRIRRRIRLRLR